MKVLSYESVGSTNDVCFEKFAEGEALPFAVVARQQTQGRGQFGRTWYSADRQNLYISFAFCPEILPKAFQDFSLRVADVLAKTLEQHLDIELTIKKPNDIFYKDRKLCGILTESKIQGDRLLLAVTGIGLNVSGTQFPPELQNIATALQTCIPDQKLSIAEVQMWVIEAMTALIAQV